MTDTKKRQHVVMLEPLKPEGSEALLVSEDGIVEHGRMGMMKEGQNLNGLDMVQLAPHRNSPMVWEVKDRVSFREEGSKGQAKVNSKLFRDNYDKIFGPPSEGSDAALN